MRSWIFSSHFNVEIFFNSSWGPNQNLVLYHNTLQTCWMSFQHTGVCKKYFFWSILNLFKLINNLWWCYCATDACFSCPTILYSTKHFQVGAKWSAAMRQNWRFLLMMPQEKWFQDIFLQYIAIVSAQEYLGLSTVFPPLMYNKGSKFVHEPWSLLT